MESRRLKRDLDEHEVLELYQPPFEARHARTDDAEPLRSCS
jgi:hypothetical protein